MQGRAVAAAAVTDLASLPGKPELYAKLLFVLQAPMQQLVTVLSAVPRDLVNVLAAAERKRTDESSEKREAEVGTGEHFVTFELRVLSSELTGVTAMADVTQQQVVEYIKGISVLELSQLVKTLESELGVSAAAAMPMAMRRWPAAAGGGAAAAEEKTEFTVIADRHRRQQDQHDQGRPRSHEPRPEGSQGPRRVGAEADQGRRVEGRGGRHQEEVRRGRRQGRGQVSTRRRARRAVRAGVVRVRSRLAARARSGIPASGTEPLTCAVRRFATWRDASVGGGLPGP